MKFPESRVPSPEIPRRVTRGSTTQNRASSTMRSATLRSIFAVTSTWRWSGDSRTAVTWPMCTSLYLTGVLPASSPWAALKTMVIVGPWLRIRWAAIPRATTAARMGITQTTDRRAPRRRTTVACGRLSRPLSSAMLFLKSRRGIPDAPRIGRFRDDHRQHHYSREERHAGAGDHRHRGLQLHQRDGEGVDEHVQHGPPADDLNRAI